MAESQHVPHGVIAERVKNCMEKFDSLVARSQGGGQEELVAGLKNEHFCFRSWKSQAETRVPAGWDGLEEDGLEYHQRDTEVLQHRLMSLLQILESALDPENSAADDVHGEVPMGETAEHDILLDLEYGSAPNDLHKSQTRRIGETNKMIHRDSCTSGSPQSSMEHDEINRTSMVPASEAGQTEASAITITTLWRSATTTISGRPRRMSAPFLSLRLPPPPQPPGQGRFTCPVCCCIVTFRSEKQWRQHIVDDLQPYVCIHEMCASAYRAYSSARQWQHHMTLAHPVGWSCPFDCNRVFTAARDLENHIVDHHNVENDILTLRMISEPCADPKDPPSSLRCTLCQCICPSRRHWFRHIQEHERQLALFALPEHVLVAATDYESDSSDLEQIRKTPSKIRFNDIERASARARHRPSSAWHAFARDPSTSSLEDVASRRDLRTRPMKKLQSRIHGSKVATKHRDLTALLSMALERAKSVRRLSLSAELESQLRECLIDTLTEQLSVLQYPRTGKASSEPGLSRSVRTEQSASKDKLRARAQTKSVRRRKLSPSSPPAAPQSRYHVPPMAQAAVASSGSEQDAQSRTDAYPEIEASMQTHDDAQFGMLHNGCTLPTVHFRDVYGNWFQFPYTIARTWAGMQQCIGLALEGAGEDWQTLIRQGKYFLIDDEGFVVLPQFWSTRVRPGLVVFMSIWSGQVNSAKTKPQADKHASRRKSTARSHKVADSADWSTEEGSSGTEEPRLGKKSRARVESGARVESMQQRTSASNNPPKRKLHKRKDPNLATSHVTWANVPFSPIADDPSGHRAAVRPTIDARSPSTFEQSRTPPSSPNKRHHSNTSYGDPRAAYSHEVPYSRVGALGYPSLSFADSGYGSNYPRPPASPLMPMPRHHIATPFDGYPHNEGGHRYGRDASLLQDPRFALHGNKEKEAPAGDYYQDGGAYVVKHGEDRTIHIFRK
ncbi:hypothetical protein BST61_g2849 [Cercospora zeina]